jgi:hypothetical protein
LIGINQNDGSGSLSAVWYKVYLQNWVD